ncbi:hypothetical protein BU23DRAFT_563470 [Bimuria novae-zelandiae CBS 107.79]|uniref:Uncharacterized protein n=1 Tax=Bimuria novae-zelandiae CBS 107.79 TaxID=1447943 RepID=A0A6A5VR37_9PLEO|nr:hypothetical protein BU23DRAFT_563470 [Bimuria novae-zelandiae CBS 107.79]
MNESVKPKKERNVQARQCNRQERTDNLSREWTCCKPRNMAVSTHIQCIANFGANAARATTSLANINLRGEILVQQVCSECENVVVVPPDSVYLAQLGEGYSSIALGQSSLSKEHNLSTLLGCMLQDKCASKSLSSFRCMLVEDWRRVYQSSDYAQPSSSHSIPPFEVMAQATMNFNVYNTEQIVRTSGILDVALQNIELFLRQQNCSARLSGLSANVQDLREIKYSYKHVWMLST